MLLLKGLQQSENNHFQKYIRLKGREDQTKLNLIQPLLQGPKNFGKKISEGVYHTLISIQESPSSIIKASEKSLEVMISFFAPEPFIKQEKITKKVLNRIQPDY